MSCSKCKKKKEREIIESEIKSMTKYAVVVIIAVFTLAIYGFVSMVNLLF